MISDQPIHQVEWIPIEKVHANDYNPNSVATQEMKLLYRSVKADGYTQPVVTIYDEKKAVVDTIKNTISSWNIKLEEARKTFEEADKAFKASSNKVAA